MSRFSPGCICCPAGQPCENCSSGFAPARLKLVVPSGTFVSNTTVEVDLDTGDFVTVPLCPTDPGCDFYAGTYFFTLDPTCTSHCCCYSICFDTEDSSGCDCEEDQTSDCPAMCGIQICINAPGFVGLTPYDPNYNITVAFIQGVADSGDGPPCGSCVNRTNATGTIIFQGDLTSSIPDCNSVSDLSCLLKFSPIVGGGSNDYCLAAPGSAVTVSVV